MSFGHADTGLGQARVTGRLHAVQWKDSEGGGERVDPTQRRGIAASIDL